MTRKNKAIQLNQGMHTVAIDQARSLANQARTVRDIIGNNYQLHDVLTFLVLSGLSLELYLKAFMLGGRNGLITKGHELKELYGEFPDFLKANLNRAYISQTKNISYPVTVLAVAQRSEVPRTPNRSELGKRFDTFEEAIKSVSNVFTRARYFFEEIKKDYSYVEYPVGQIGALIQALDRTYEKYLTEDLID